MFEIPPQTRIDGIDGINGNKVTSEPPLYVHPSQSFAGVHVHEDNDAEVNVDDDNFETETVQDLILNRYKRIYVFVLYLCLLF